MKNKLTLNYSIELLATLTAIAGVLAALYTFLIGEHYIIPTIILAYTILLFNLANDLGETKNLAADKPKITKEMTSLVTAWYKTMPK